MHRRYTEDLHKLQTQSCHAKEGAEEEILTQAGLLVEQVFQPGIA